MLKAQLPGVFQLSETKLVDFLLSVKGLGDSKPMQLMKNMLALLGSGNGVIPLCSAVPAVAAATGAHGACQLTASAPQGLAFAGEAVRILLASWQHQCMRGSRCSPSGGLGFAACHKGDLAQVGAVHLRMDDAALAKDQGADLELQGCDWRFHILGLRAYGTVPPHGPSWLVATSL